MTQQYGAKKEALTAVTTTTAGGALSVVNPLGVDLIVTDLILDITTEATGSATVDAGIAADGTTSADNLIDAGNVGAAVAVLNNVDNAGSNGKKCVKWGATEYLTITASATLAGLVGNAYIKWVIE